MGVVLSFIVAVILIWVFLEWTRDPNAGKHRGDGHDDDDPGNLGSGYDHEAYMKQEKEKEKKG